MMPSDHGAPCLAIPACPVLSDHAILAYPVLTVQFSLVIPVCSVMASCSGDWSYCHTLVLVLEYSFFGQDMVALGVCNKLSC